jgi:hypothetical protein
MNSILPEGWKLRSPSGACAEDIGARWKFCKSDGDLYLVAVQKNDLRSGTAPGSVYWEHRVFHKLRRVLCVQHFGQSLGGRAVMELCERNAANFLASLTQLPAGGA